jgi:hypothetical protein
MRRTLLLGSLGVVLLASGRVAAHGGESDPHAVAGPIAFAIGVAVLAVAVAADARDLVRPGLADAGVAAGIVLAVGGLAVYYVL